MSDPIRLMDVMDDGVSLEGQCSGCRRIRRIDPASLDLPGGLTLLEVAGKMRCRHCDTQTILLRTVPGQETQDSALHHPAIQEVMTVFPDAKITITDRTDD